MTVIERFEENIAILEETDTGEFIEVNRTLLCENAKEGDVVEKSGETYMINAEKTNERRTKIVNRLRKMGL